MFRWVNPYSLPSYRKPQNLSAMSRYLRIRDLARNMRKHSTPAEEFLAKSQKQKAIWAKVSQTIHFSAAN